MYGVADYPSCVLLHGSLTTQVVGTAKKGKKGVHGPEDLSNKKKEPKIPKMPKNLF